jgi:hypothetical protein
MLASMLWRVSRPLRSLSKPPGFILPCQPALADRPPSGPGWLHEIKFDGYRVIARKDGEQVAHALPGFCFQTIGRFFAGPWKDGDALLTSWLQLTSNK